MEWLWSPGDWVGRLLFQRGLALVYVIAFVVAARQGPALLGERGLLPIPRYLGGRRLREVPSLFTLRYSDRLWRGISWLGATLAGLVLVGVVDRGPIGVSMAVWFALWLLYLSIVNVGQLWYGFGWESLLLETGFLAVFIGSTDVAPPWLVLLALRWLLFRVEFVGLIKIRGDECWRDLTCLRYHHETQPMPNPLSWLFHRLPMPLHRVEVAANHVTQLGVPFLLFLPQPIAGVGASIMVVTQCWLLLSGNFAWLNALTIVIGLSVAGGPVLGPLLGVDAPVDVHDGPTWFGAVVIVVAAGIAVLSRRPLRNLVSSRQVMNASFDKLHLVNTYGAFGRVTKVRNEIVVEGARGEEWREYEFKGKPRRRDAPPAAGGAVPPAARLAHVVCRPVAGLRPGLVADVHDPAPRERSGDAPPPARFALPRRTARPRARPALSLPVHHAGRAPGERGLVASRAGGGVHAPDVAR